MSPADRGVSGDEGYERVAAAAATAILFRLRVDLRARDLDPLELWEHWLPGAEIEPGTTWLQWSVAHEWAREKIGLPPKPYGPDGIAFVFSMDDPLALAGFKKLVEEGYDPDD